MQTVIEKIELNDKSIVYAFENDYITSKIKSSNDYYESTLLRRFNVYIPKESVIYDIGANIGNHTVYFSKYTNPKKIYSFEPVKEVYEVLQKNIEANSIQCAQAFNAAIGNRDGKVSMEVCDENLGGNKVIDDDNGEVNLISLDNFDIIPPSFIKIDVEGYEYNVLLGMKSMLIKYQPVIWIEIFKENFKDINKLLNELGYEIIERVESNCIYKVPQDDNEKKKLQEQFKNNIISYYEETIDLARKKYRSSCENVDKIKESLNSANQKYRQVSENYAKLNEKLKDKNDEVIKLKETLKDTQVHYDKLIEKANRKIEENQDTLLTKNKYIDELKNENIEKEDEIEKLSSEIREALQFTTENLKKKDDMYREVLNKNEILNKKISETVGEIEKLKTNVSELEKEILDKDKIIEQFEENKIKMQNTVNSLNSKNEELEDTIKRLYEERKDILLNRNMEIELLSKKALTYIEHIEKLVDDNNKNEIFNNKIEQDNKRNLNKEQYIEQLEKDTSQKQVVVNNLNVKIKSLEKAVEILQQEKKDVLQIRNNEIEQLSNKALIYLEYIEKMMEENEELNQKRGILIERTELLYANNKKLVEELKNLKERYKALRGSKLGKLIVFYWRLKRRWKQR